MLKSVFDLFFPKLCLSCSDVLRTGEKTLCAYCRHDLPVTDHFFNPQNEIHRKFYGRLPLEYAASMVYFFKEGMVQRLMHQLKYRGQQQVGQYFGSWGGQLLSQGWLENDFDYIIPVPLHKKRLRERGYNQLTLFGQELSKSLQIPFKEDLLHRDLYDVTQTKKNFLDRTSHKKTYFGIHQDDTLRGSHFLLIDDVITSGSTLESCGKLLLSIPNCRLSILTIAYTS
jgi:ComF family protein